MKNLLFMLLLFSGGLYASPYPVITSITTKLITKSGQPAHQLDFTQAILEIGPAADQLVPNGYFLGLGLHTRDGGGDHVGLNGVMYEGPKDKYETIGQLAMRYYNEHGKNMSSTWIYDYHLIEGSDMCMGYIAGTIYSVGINELNWEGSIRPGGCTIAPPATDWCKLTTPEILLDHGNLTLRNAEGDTARANVNVQCTTETAVTFNLVTDDKYVYLDEGKSEISVEDKPLNTPITLPSGNSSVTVKDYLTGVTKEGYHTGSSVLVMMPY